MTVATEQPPRAQGTHRGERAVVLVIATVGLVGLVVARLWPVSSVISGETTCLLRMTTGLPCPGCGMTRAWVYVAHGDLLTAFEYNLFGPIGMAAAAGIVAYVALALVRRRPPEQILSRVNPKLLLGLIVVWMAYSVVRIVSLGLGQEYFAIVVS